MTHYTTSNHTIYQMDFYFRFLYQHPVKSGLLCDVNCIKLTIGDKSMRDIHRCLYDTTPVFNSQCFKLFRPLQGNNRKRPIRKVHHNVVRQPSLTPIILYTINDICIHLHSRNI